MSGLDRSIVFLVILFFWFLPAALAAQEPFRVMFYNVENLYDTINNPKTQDDEFTPNGNLHWGEYRYRKKLEDISKVISSLGGKYPPAIVGLCEVENGSVLKDLTEKSSLAKHKYKYTLSHSKDARGSNVALLYQRDQMQLLQKHTYTPAIGKDRKTRDILHVVGKVVSGDTLDIFVCHYPSRSEGVAKSAPHRLAVSKLLKKKIDNLFDVRQRANIIVMGDFNDYPHDVSVKDVLGAKSIKEEIRSKQLYNLFFHRANSATEIASYKYQGKWGYLDQFLVSGELLKQNNTTYIQGNEAQVYEAKFLLDYDEKHQGMKPLRTYSGWQYLGGTSDHLPIYFDLMVEE